MTTSTAYVDVKDIAADIRKAIRTAQKDGDEILAGLKISVRIERASMCSAIDIDVQGLPIDELRQPAENSPYDDDTEWTEQARQISERVHKLAQPGMDWHDGKMHFCHVTFAGGTFAPAPRFVPADEDSIVEAEIVDEDEERAEAYRTQSTATCDHGRLLWQSCSACGVPAYEPPAEDEQPLAVVLPMPAKPVLHVISDDESLILESLNGSYGVKAQRIAQLVVEAGIETDTVADARETARRFRATFEALGLDLPA